VIAAASIIEAARPRPNAPFRANPLMNDAPNMQRKILTTHKVTVKYYAISMPNG
jgi:hypothetical protein